MNTPPIAVFGAMSTNEILFVDSVVGTNQVIYTDESEYIAGGKAMNIARMIKTLLPKNTVYFCSKTSKDNNKLWKYPYIALKKDSIDTNYVICVSNSKYQPNRVIAQIEKNTGKKSYIVMSGITNTYNSKDLDKQEKVFSTIKQNGGIIVVTFEIPPATAVDIMKRANNLDIPIFVDPGGVMPGFKLNSVYDYPIALLKPNRYEAEVLTGIKVKDAKTARKAGAMMLKGQIKNVLLTAGEDGAYLFNNLYDGLHIPAQKPNKSSKKNAAGCGDQVMATFCAFYQQKRSVLESAKIAIKAGTCQINKSGITPVTMNEICN